MKHSLTLCCLILAGVASADFDTNLIQNPGAELYTGSANEGPNTFDYWNQVGPSGLVLVDSYSVYPVNYAGAPDPNPGLTRFFGGNAGDSLVQPGYTQLTQTAALSSNMLAKIDAGQGAFNLSAYLGGRNQFATDLNDEAKLTVSFLSSANSILGSAEIMTTQDWIHSQTLNKDTMQLFSTNGFVPVGTRFVVFDLSFLRHNGTFSNGGADSLNFSVSAVPEPASMSVMALGVFGLIARKRKIK